MLPKARKKLGVKRLNRICYHFNCYLSPIHSHGLVLIDRFSDTQIDSHLRKKFSTGLTGMPYGDTLKLQNIVGFHYSAIGQSHFGSLIDIVIGSFRYAVTAVRGKLCEVGVRA